MSFSEDNYQLHKRQISAFMGQYHLRYLRRLSEVFDGDLELPLILGEVAFRNISHLLTGQGRSPDGFDQLVIRAREEGKLLPCSAMSASLATGLPRETVRRKLNKLAKEGFLTKLPDSSFVTTSKPLEYFSEILDKKLLIDLLDSSSKIAILLDGG